MIRKCLLGSILLPFAASCDRGHSSPSRPDDRSAPATAPATAPAGTQSAEADPDPSDRLVGAWVADDVDAAIGRVKIQVTFRKEGRVKILAWSDLPFVGQVRDKSGPYEADGHTISSSAIRGGTSVQYHFDGPDTLVIQYAGGKQVRFSRK